MTVFEIILLLIGIICVVLSFVLFDKIDGKETVSEVKINAELSEKQKEDIKKQVADIIGEQIEEISEKTELSLEKMSNEKISELGEYSETVIGEMNKTHDKVMFLYDMLTEKNKEVHSTVRDLSVAKDQLNKAMEQSAMVARMESESEPTTPEAKRAANRKKVEESLDELMEAAPKARRRKTSEKSDKESAKTNGNNRNKEIMALHNAGLSNLEIAKELNIGTGEVKLVLDLFKGNK